MPKMIIMSFLHFLHESLALQECKDSLDNFPILLTSMDIFLYVSLYDHMSTFPRSVDILNQILKVSDTKMGYNNLETKLH